MATSAKKPTKLDEAMVVTDSPRATHDKVREYIKKKEEIDRLEAEIKDLREFFMAEYDREVPSHSETRKPLFINEGKYGLLMYEERRINFDSTEFKKDHQDLYDEYKTKVIETVKIIPQVQLTNIAS